MARSDWPVYPAKDIPLFRERMLAFWNHAIHDRVCACVLAPRTPGAHISMFHNTRDMTTEPEALRDYWEDAATIADNAVARIGRTYWGGEAMPALFPNFGTSGHCRFYGAKPTYGNDTLWFDPCWDTLDREIVLDCAELNRQVAMVTEYARCAQGRFFVGMPDSCGTLDAITHLYGASETLFAMQEEPDLLLRASEALDQGWRASNALFYEAARDNNGGAYHAWMHLWAPGTVAQMQCDLSVMISPTMFAEFAMPELRRQSDWADYPVYHFDGVEQERHLPMILSLDKLRAVQWTEVAGQPSPAHFIPILRRIQEAGKSLIVMCPPPDIEPLLSGLSHQGLYLHTSAGSPEEAEEILNMIEKRTKRV